MTSYPPTPAFGGFPIPAPKPAFTSTHTLRKTNSNNSSSGPTSPALQSPAFFTANTPTPHMVQPPSTMDGAEDREEGELSDGEEHVEAHIVNDNPQHPGKERTAYVPGSWRDHNHHAKDFDHTNAWQTGFKKNNTEFSKLSQLPRHNPWNNSYHTYPRYPQAPSAPVRNQDSPITKGFENFETVSPGFSRDEQPSMTEKIFDPPSHPKGVADEEGRTGNVQDQRPPATSAATSSAPNSHPLSSLNKTPSPKGLTKNKHALPSSFARSPPQTTKSVEELRKEAERAVLNMLPLKVDFKYMVEEEGINPKILRKVFSGIGFRVPLETPPPSSVIVSNPSATAPAASSDAANTKPKERPVEKKDTDKDAAALRKKLEKEARDRERKAAEASAAELVRQREAIREKEERKRRSAEVEAKKEILRKKIDELKIPVKTVSPVAAPTPVSHTPVAAALARSTQPPQLPQSQTQIPPRIPGLLLGNADEPMLDISNQPALLSPPAPQVQPQPQPQKGVSKELDTEMADAPAVTETPAPVLAQPPIAIPGLSTLSASHAIHDRSQLPRKKRPLAADLYFAETIPTKRKFGAQRSSRLVIHISDDEEEASDSDAPYASSPETRTSRSTPIRNLGNASRRSASTANNSPPGLKSSNTAPIAGFGVQPSKTSQAKALQDKEDQIKALKAAIQKAQQKKKLKAGASAPTPVGTPDLVQGPTFPPPIPSPPATENAEEEVKKQLEKAEEMKKIEEKKNKKLVEEAARKAIEEAKKINEEKMKNLLDEVKKIEGAEIEKKKKQAAEEAVAQKRKVEREERQRKLQEYQGVREERRLVMEKLRLEMERIERESREMEEAKKALELELDTMDDVRDDNGVDASEDYWDETLAMKRNEIEALKKAMSNSEGK
ncbi:hypothetical protein RUND412_002585 [Rhizina undulata]